MDTLKKKKGKQAVRQAVGQPLDIVESDKVTKTDSVENKRRRTIILTKQNNSWGFTLQTYGIRHSSDNALEDLTYVDYVEFGGAGYYGGMRAGDVILSINGISVESLTHRELVQFIKKCDHTMRMVVLFEDCVRKIDLHFRFLKLKAVLQDKVFEYRALDIQEKRLLQGLSPFETKSMCPSIDSNDMTSDESTLDNEPYSPSNVEFKDLDLTDRSSLVNFYMSDEDSGEKCDSGDSSLDDFAELRARSVSCLPKNTPKQTPTPPVDKFGAIKISVNADVHSQYVASAINIPDNEDLFECKEMSAHSCCDENCLTKKMTPLTRLDSIDSMSSLEVDESLLDSGYADKEWSPDIPSPIEIIKPAGVGNYKNGASSFVMTFQSPQSIEDLKTCSNESTDYSVFCKKADDKKVLGAKDNDVELENISLQFPTEEGALSLCDFIRHHGNTAQQTEGISDEEESTDL